jgi:hypothetical protein
MSRGLLDGGLVHQDGLFITDMGVFPGRARVRGPSLTLAERESYFRRFEFILLEDANPRFVRDSTPG